jgi:hypothetical protein
MAEVELMSGGSQTARRRNNEVASTDASKNSGVGL